MTSLVPLPARDLTLGGESFRIPPETAELLYVSDDDPTTGHTGLGISLSFDIGSGQIRVEGSGPTEPSTIYLRLPVRRPVDPAAVSRPSYYPSYAELTPEQRWVYLAWLCDVAAPVNIGWVFLYYYGLERQLLTGPFEAALTEVVRLRQHHSHSSFRSYTGRALLGAALMRKRHDVLAKLFVDRHLEGVDELTLLLLYSSRIELSATTITELGLRLPGVNRRYIKAARDVFEDALQDGLAEAFGRPAYPFADRFDLRNLPRVPFLLFANVSLAPGVRSPKLPHFLLYDPFVAEVGALLRNAHEVAKVRLAEMRRAGRRRMATPGSNPSGPAV
jgi:hypothetical protein